MADFKRDAKRVKNVKSSKRLDTESNYHSYKRSKSNESEQREPKAKDKKSSFNYKGFVRGTYNALDNFRIPFIDGNLSIANVFYMVVICMIAVFVCREILFYGSDNNPITFTSLLNWFSNIEMLVDFTSFYNWVADWPTFLAFLKPLANLIGLVVELLVGIMSFIAQFTLFIVTGA